MSKTKEILQKKAKTSESLKESIEDDLWFELSSEIQDLIQDFVVATANSFGVEFHDVYVQWG